MGRRGRVQAKDHLAERIWFCRLTILPGDGYAQALSETRMNNQGTSRYPKPRCPAGSVNLGGKRVKSNDNLTERIWFYQLIILPGGPSSLYNRLIQRDTLGCSPRPEGSTILAEAKVDVFLLEVQLRPKDCRLGPVRGHE